MLKGHKSSKRKDTHLSPLRSHGQNSKPKANLNPAEREVLKALKRDTNVNLTKADKRNYNCSSKHLG